MKRLLTSYCVALALIVAPVSLTFQGCRTTTEIAVSAETSEQIILRAEQTAQTSLLTFDTLVRLERDNSDALVVVNPKIHEYANYIRGNGLNWITSLRNATKTFKANRTAENKSNLNTWLVTLTKAVTETNSYINKAKAVVK